MSDQAPPPAGWYPDPQTGVQRWWDGAQWGASAQVVQVVPQQRVPLNGNAGASFWLGLGAFLFMLLWPIAMLVGTAAVVVGFIGYRSARRLRQRGTGWSTWGIILGGIAALVGFGALAFTIFGD